MTEFALLKDVREEKTGLLDKIALLEKEIESLKTLQRNTTTENDLEVADNNLANQLHAAEIGLMTSSIDGLKQELSNKNSDIAVLQ